MAKDEKLKKPKSKPRASSPPPTNPVARAAHDLRFGICEHCNRRYLKRKGGCPCQERRP